MVMYCCVKNCNNNSTLTRKKDPNTVLSFHAFPSKQELKTKWLRAIGRPNWDPPRYARICSVHFDSEQVQLCDDSRGRLEHDAVPSKALPINTNFDASNVETCRICLATDIKMYNIQSGQLSIYMDVFLGRTDNFIIEGLPQFVCYLCTAEVIRCYRLIEKSMASQTVLLDIFALNGQITKNLIKEYDKSKLVLNPLACYNTTNDYHFQYDDENQISLLSRVESSLLKNETNCAPKNNSSKINPRCKPKIFDNEHVKKCVSDKKIFDKVSLCMNMKSEMDFMDEIAKKDIPSKQIEGVTLQFDRNTRQNEEIKSDDDNEFEETDIEENILTPIEDINSDGNNEIEETYIEDINSDSDNEFEETYIEDINSDGDNEFEETYIEDIDSDSDNELEETDIEENILSPIEDMKSDSKIEIIEKIVKKNKPKKEINIKYETCNTERKKADGLTPCESDMQEYFNIVKLSLPEQIEEWQKTVSRRHLKIKTVYECGTCGRRFAQVKPFNTHMSTHDPSRGPAECPVCKQRFKNERVAISHLNREHSKKFCCKICPREFLTLRVAKKHQPLHAGDVYPCTLCPHVSAHAETLSAHMLRRHRNTHACAGCGRVFASAYGVAVHQALYCSSEEGKGENSCHRCEQCGINFASEGAKLIHMLSSSQHNKNTDISEAERPQAARMTARRAAKDLYPTQCQLCDKTVTSRMNHWHHVRWQHPKQIDTYKAEIKVVCDKCGKGFQSSAQLRAHQMRHASEAPTVRCPRCPRLFYDKYALKQHAGIHAPVRHECRTCGATFTLRTNLLRHATRVHSDATPYACSICDKRFKYSTSRSLHVRTVHYKLPHPPRKKRSRRAAVDVNNDM